MGGCVVGRVTGLTILLRTTAAAFSNGGVNPPPTNQRQAHRLLDPPSPIRSVTLSDLAQRFFSPLMPPLYQFIDYCTPLYAVNKSHPACTGVTVVINSHASSFLRSLTTVTLILSGLRDRITRLGLFLFPRPIEAIFGSRRTFVVLHHERASGWTCAMGGVTSRSVTCRSRLQGRAQKASAPAADVVVLGHVSVM